MHGVPPGIVNPPAPIPLEVDKNEAHRTPGTLVLVFVFLAAFATYYFVNWKLLAALWQIG
jgi:hypothetical protein